MGTQVAYIVAAMADRQNMSQSINLVPTLLLSERQHSKWCRPDPEFLKLNTDGAYMVQSGEGGWGFVIRDHMGAVHKAGEGREYFL
jgi:hypothetical protein